MGAGVAARLADGDPHARYQHLPEVDHGAGQGRHPAPGDKRQGYDGFSRIAVREQGDGHAQGGVKKREGKSAQQADLGIGQAQLRLDRLDKNVEYLAIQAAEDIGRQQQAEDITSIAECWLHGVSGLFMIDRYRLPVDRHYIGIIKGIPAPGRGGLSAAP